MNLLRFYQICLLVTLFIFGQKVYAIEAPEVPSCQPSTECCKKQSLNYDSKVNRCLTRDEVAIVQKETSACMKLETEAAQQDCYKQNAEAALAKSNLKAANESLFLKGSGSTTQTIISALNVGAGAYAIFGLKGCNNTSFTLMKTAAILTAVNEIGTYIWYRAGLKKLEKEYSDIVDSPGEKASVDSQKITAKNAQAEAFRYLSDREKLFMRVAKTKGGIYATSGVLYGIAAVVAIFESTPPIVVGTSCVPIKGQMDQEMENGLLDASYIDMRSYVLKENLRQIYKTDNWVDTYFLYQELQANLRGENYYFSFEQYSLLKKINFNDNEKDLIRDSLKLAANIVQDSLNLIISSAEASEEEKKALSLAGARKATKAAFKKVGGAIQKAISTATGRAVISGGLAASSGLLSAHAFKQAGLAKDRKNYLDGVYADFLKNAGETFARCTDKDRLDPRVPECYCYMPIEEGGGPNKARSASQICQKRWKDKPALAGKKYDEDDKSENSDNPKFCLNNKERFDYKCSCAADNSCAKLLGKFQFPGNFGNLGNSILSDTEKLFGGRMSGADMDTNSLQQKAAHLRDAAEKLKSENPEVAKDILAFEQGAGDLLKDYPEAAKLEYAANTGIGTSGSSDMSGLPSTIAKEVEKKLEADGKFREFKTGSGTVASVAPSTAKKPDFNFSFGNEGSSEGGVTIDDSAPSVEPTYEIMKDSAVNQESDSNLFDILSLRYQKSGLRRMFGSKEEQQLYEDAASSDINK